jgi:hypothetical protein
VLRLLGGAWTASTAKTILCALIKHSFCWLNSPDHRSTLSTNIFPSPHWQRWTPGNRFVKNVKHALLTFVNEFL